MHCLVVDLDTRLAAGETLPTMPPWHVQENKWRAARYGLDAIVILDADSDERLVTDDLADLLERLAPVADRLGCADELRVGRRHPAPRGVVPAAARGRRRAPAATWWPSSTRWSASCATGLESTASRRSGSVISSRTPSSRTGRSRSTRSSSETAASASAVGVVGRRRQGQAAGDGDERPVAAP